MTIIGVQAACASSNVHVTELDKVTFAIKRFCVVKAVALCCSPEEVKVNSGLRKMLSHLPGKSEHAAGENRVLRHAVTVCSRLSLTSLEMGHSSLAPAYDSGHEHLETRNDWTWSCAGEDQVLYLPCKVNIQGQPCIHHWRWPHLIHCAKTKVPCLSTMVLPWDCRVP